ncbi:MAG: hypothetical protein ACFE8L_01295 [Candidatus Hodarchaeota archaeon]
MNTIWDTKSDTTQKGDNLRDVSPLIDKTRIDENGFTHYFFSKIMFNNPWYYIPENNQELFNKFIEGGSRAYPSDGYVPCDIVAKEARFLLEKIIELSQDSESHHFEEAVKALENGKNALVRGTIKLYLGKYTTRDWRRKRFTDDIDFWIHQVHILHHVLKRSGWIKNNITKEWEKKIKWRNLITNEERSATLIAANDLDQLLDFGAGSYLEGSSLKEIFQKKLKRGHDVDLSDIVNVIMVNGADGKYIGDESREQEWYNAWKAFEEAANTRNTRITSNLISLCRVSLGIADHLERVSNTIKKYNDIIFDKTEYPDKELERICRISIHWKNYLKDQGPEATREMIHNFYHGEFDKKAENATNLKNFVKKLLDLLNSKYQHLKVIFEIENFII